MINKLIIVVVWLFLFLFSLLNVNALSITVPSTEWNDDIIINGEGSITWEGVGWFWKNIFIKINDYLWVFMVIITWIFLIRWWIRLIIAQWSDEEFNKTNNIIIFSLIWIGVSIGSYLIIRLITNLL